METPPTSPLKKATNIRLSGDVLANAKVLGINVSQTCDGFLPQRVKQESVRHCLSHHAKFIAECNKPLEKERLPLDQYHLARFDVYANPDAEQCWGIPLLLDVQCHLLETLDSPVVVPLHRLDQFAKVSLPRNLAPSFEVDGTAHVMSTQFLAAVPESMLKTCLSSQAHHRDEITAALNLLFHGFWPRTDKQFASTEVISSKKRNQSANNKNLIATNSMP